LEETVTSLCEAALAYARVLGWPVHPLRPRAKEAISTHGHRDATTDPERIERWWRAWPDANIGVACDERSGLLVLDIDPRNGGDVNLEALLDEHGPLPETPEALTGGGGRHLVFRRPVAPTFRARLCPGGDVKANGYIVAPPSVHESGRSYVWEASSRPDEIPLADLPPWVLSMILDFRPRVVFEADADVDGCFLVRAFGEAGLLGRKLDRRRYAVRCPWESEHTGGARGSESSTVIFAPTANARVGWFYCAHTSHGRKSQGAVLAALPREAVNRAAARTIEATAVKSSGSA
jgi:hypothetical protein